MERYQGEHFAGVPDSAEIGWRHGSRSEAEKKYSFGRWDNDGVNVFKFESGAITVNYIPTGKTLSFSAENAQEGWDWAKSRAKHCKRVNDHFH